jgi:hypothetical protein
MLIFTYLCIGRRFAMSHTVEYNGPVGEKLETAIQIGCNMVSRSKEVRKKLSASVEEEASLKKALKELDRMSLELVDKLFEINARIASLEERKESGKKKANKIFTWLSGMLRKTRKKIESMRLAYQDIYSL